MSPRVLLFLLLPACAGPSLHRTASAAEAEAVRPSVASTLRPSDPLAASNCGLPTAPCSEPISEPEQKDEGHHDQHDGPAAPAEPPKAEPSAPPEKKEEGHHHQHGGPAAPAEPPKAEPPATPAPKTAPPKKEDHHHHPSPPAAPPVKDPPESSEATSVIDPVCKMKIDASTAKGGTLSADGTQHWFCSSSCRRSFLSQHPEAK